MIRTIPFLLIILIALGCSSGIQSEEQKPINTLIYEEFGKEVYLPSFDGLEISYVYVQYNSSGEPRSIDIQYSTEMKDDVVEFFRNAENVKDWEEQFNAKKLYGPYEGDVVFILSVNNYPLGISGAKTIINETEVSIQDENEVGFTIHSFTIDNEYSLAYNTNAFFKGDDIIDFTGDFLENIK
ncbi:hypothetical protein BKP35_08350 [Anaerobacillus arseniciselenatis]|uniref:Lipoprotein n=1 Tax=Anaerobacillus arseniciselenatis TaxID=85682 RepID=A0A1S2LQF3_9BACI|nr:hypothetical protein [Anaerobacillus arseniciselenatis]OIJ13917.1 hypothetical protein BKP35_08350 [Anaerobacillus arseniciselenatis]